MLVSDGRGRALEFVVAAAGVALAYALPAPLARVAPVVAAAVFLALELAYGRLTFDRYWPEIFLVAGILAAGYGARAYAERLRAAASPAEGDEQPDVVAHGARADERLNGRRRLDPLTYELERSRRASHQLSLLVVRLDDADGFARRGPEVLDAALDVVADAVGAQLRATDVPFRRGREDFWIVLPETPGVAARTVAERIRLAACSSRVELGPGDVVDVSVSIGSSSFPDDADTNEVLAARATDALARAVELGGNRSVLYSVPAGSPRSWGVATA